MIIYISTFIISLILIYIALLYKNNKPLFILLSIISLIPPLFIASYRSLEIGRDITIYIKPLFIIINKFNSYFDYYSSITIVRESLFLLIEYYCFQISNNLSFLFFIIEVLVIVPIYYILVKNSKKNTDVLLGMFIFYTFLYNASFNMARQSIALAFSIACIYFLQNNKLIKMCICLCIAINFHSSAILLLFIIMIYYVLKSNKLSIKFKKIFKNSLILISIILFIFFKEVVALLLNVGIINGKYIIYITNFERKADFSISNTLFYGIILLILYLSKKNKIKKIENIDFYTFISSLGLIMLQYGSRFTYADRISYYFLYPSIFLVLPQFSAPLKKVMKKNEIVINILLISLFAFYWFFWIILLKYHSTYPYVFIWE